MTENTANRVFKIGATRIVETPAMSGLTIVTWNIMDSPQRIRTGWRRQWLTGHASYDFHKKNRHSAG